MPLIPVMQPRLPLVDDVAPYLRRMDANRVYTNFGPLAEELEARYAERFAVPAGRVVACSSATLGIEGAVSLSPATRFHCPAWTFPATPLAIVNAGKSLAFADVDADDWTMQNPAPQPGEGLVPVVPFGAEIALEQWSAWPEVIVDAAASGGVDVRDLSMLPPGWAVVLSIHATKVLGAGEGGIVFFGDDDRAERFRAFTVLGFQGRRESDFVGTNAKMPEMVAAYGLAALDAWDVEEAQWRAARALVTAVESDLALSGRRPHLPGVNPYWVVSLESAEHLARMEEVLADAKVQTRRWWPVPCPRMGAFSSRWGEVETPHSDLLAATTLGLPFSRDLAPADVDQVAAALARGARG